MMEQPLVSILVANYNNGRFIAETLESAMAQTYPNLEVIVADDGSTDNSVQVIEAFMASHPTVRIKFFRNDDNKGCGRVKRQCIEKSEGRYFCFLDPDDTIVPEAVETLMQGFKDHPECGIVYCTHYLCNEKLEPQGVSEYPGAIPEGQSHLTSTGGHISALALCRREIYDRTSGIDASYWVSEDQDLYLKMEEQAPVFFVNRPMYYYRKHDHNTSWSEQKTFENYYWKYICEKAAYKRRKKNSISIDNLSKREMRSKTFSFYLRLEKMKLRDKWPPKQRKQVLYFDLLRVLATLAVVMLHISSSVYFNAEQYGTDFWAGVGFNIPTRWAVPVFVMLSGALFLNPRKEIKLKSIYGKYILRLLVAFVVWTLLYELVFAPSMYWIKGLPSGPIHVSLVYDTPVHLWFLPMLMGVYMMIPMARTIAKENRVLDYFLVLWLILSVVSFVPGAVSDTVNQLQIKMVLGFVGYFLLGYKLSVANLKLGIWTLSALLVVALLLTLTLCGLSSDVEQFLNPLAPNVIVLSATVFLMAKKLDGRIRETGVVGKILGFVRDDLFGIYLIHVFYIWLFFRPHFVGRLSPVLSIPLVTVVVFLASLFTIKLLRKIPGVRYICS